MDEGNILEKMSGTLDDSIELSHLLTMDHLPISGGPQKKK